MRILVLHQAMNIDILIVSYRKDLEWFRWSTLVLKANLTGYRNIIATVPHADVPFFAPICEERGIKLVGREEWPGKGYHSQQWEKISADSYSDAEYIVHMDSDTFIAKPTDLSEYFVDGKPAWMWSYYSDFQGDVPWKAPTKRATGLDCPMEFMCAFPFILHRSTYQLTRDHLQRQHNMPPMEYISLAADRGSTSFSEFNVLGRIAFEFQQDGYFFLDRNRDASGQPSQAHWPKGLYNSRQWWSHAPISDHIDAIKAMLGEDENPSGIRCTRMGHWIPSIDTHIGKWVEEAGRLDCDGYLLPRILKYVKPGDVVVDVGANIGDHTHGYAKAVLGNFKDGTPIETGRVLAFEPNPVAFECLQRNMRGHGHVQCISKGLSNHAGGAMSMVQSPNVGASHMVNSFGGDIVEVTTLDSYGLQKCDLIKVDAEGFEYVILQGAWQTITTCRPIVIMEINRGALARNGVLPEDIYQWFALRGYKVHHAEAGPQFDIFCLPE